MASLYICDLHPDVTEITLFEKFCNVGQIHSIRVCRDDVTRQSLGYAYVKFCKEADAETALYTMNHDPIKGRPIRIVWSHRDPALSEFGVGSIYIDNLEESIGSKALFDTFSAFGNILFCKVSCLSDVSKGVGFIHFETEEAALRAINKMNGMLLKDKKVFVGKFHFKKTKEKGHRVCEQRMFSSEPLTASMLAAAQPQEQKQMLGECLYPLIESSHPDLASKITGMLLEIDNSELLHILESPKSLKAKVEEAVVVLQAHQSKVAAQARQNRRAQSAHAPVTQKMPTLQNDKKVKMNNSSATTYPMASLYVGDLHPDVTEAMLYEKFSQAGRVLSIRVCRDVITQRSLGYAYVNFQQPADAERALDTMNYDPIKGRPIRIMWSKRDPSLRKSVVGNIFIKNLDKSIDNKALYDTFSAFGNILACKVSCQGGFSNGYGFVHFETEEAALRAINKVNGMLLNDKKVFVGKFRTRSERIKKMSERACQFTNCFIKNFGDKLDDEGLRKMFEKYGTIRSVAVMKDSNGNSRGFGFVAFDKHEEAQSAVDALNGTKIENSSEVLYVGRAQKKQERQNELRSRFKQQKQDHNHRVNKNLYKDVTEDDLHEAFSPYGTVTSANRQEPLTASMLAAAQPQEQKQMLGQRLRPLIESSHPDLASKITGMLLEIDNSELLHMLESHKYLKVMVDEAAFVLQTYGEVQDDEKTKMNNSSATTYPMASLYVTDLHPDVTEAILYEKFSQAGPVLSIRVCRDVITRQSLGYGYVNFQQPADAESALNTMNHDPIKGRQIFIMWKKNDPSYQKSGVGIIFLKNLDKSIDNKALYDTFLAFGNILFCKVTCQDGVPNGYGFVYFDTEEAALHAINKANGMLLNGKKTFVGKFFTRSQHATKMGERVHQFTNCFIKNFGDKLDKKGLRKMFEKYGTIRSVAVMKDRRGKSRGFGFVDFSKHEEAQKAVDALNGTKIGNSNKVLYVGRAQGKQERQNELRSQFEQQKQDRIQRFQGVNLYVKNLDHNITEDDLREAFNQYGTITSAKIMYDAEVSRGFGFVCFSSPEEATKAVTEMNGRIVGSKPLYVALAQRKEDRKAHLTAQYMKKMGVTWPYQLMSQSFQAAGAPGYFMPFQGAQRTYMPSHLIRATPRWQSPTQASFQMAGDMRTVGPRAMTTPIRARGAMHPTRHVMQPQVMQPFKYTQSVRNPNIAGYPQPAQTQNQQQPDSAQPQEQK